VRERKRYYELHRASANLTNDYRIYSHIVKSHVRCAYKAVKDRGDTRMMRWYENEYPDLLHDAIIDQKKTKR
jgi:hypothetical protein